jgi:hypothetical protein
MRKPLANVPLMTLAAVFFAVIGVLLSMCLRDFIWFERFGSMITCVGILLLSRPALVGQDILLDVKMTTGLSSLDPEHYRAVDEPIPPAVIQDRRSRRAVYQIGPSITIIGTIIWGFGDLLNGVFGFSHR